MLLAYFASSLWAVNAATWLYMGRPGAALIWAAGAALAYRVGKWGAA